MLTYMPIRILSTSCTL